MTIQDYEAIAAYDRGRAALTPEAVLILDSSSCAAALGIYRENGQPQIEGIWNPDAETSFETLVSRSVDWKDHADALKNAVRRYYLSGRTIDPTVPDIGQPVSEILALCEPVFSGFLETAFRSADSILAGAGISPSGMRILLTGPLAGFFPLEAAARLHYSPAMPMMPDSRYVLYPETDSLLSEGRTILGEFSVKRIADTVVWQLLRLTEDGRTEPMHIFLAHEDTRVTDLETPVFAGCGEIFVCAGDELTVSVSGTPLTFPVPDGFLQNEAGTVNLGLQYRGGAFYLLLRSSRTPAEAEYPINIRLKGKK